ncbi:hypothetical protein HXZ27_10005 [Micromonospora carbonacea subsp. aurantiaca]|uniref:Phage integrase family protein n=1 Tax=Micromonospora carbonacea TaxID=47853 RepID=A0A7H8XVW8_9ACTN|nr:hypothetical protein HXZ27_10005 [Micromonospora carbonacea]
MWLASDSVPINDVAKVMGHEKISATINRYTHSTSGRGRRVLASLGAYRCRDRRTSLVQEVEAAGKTEGLDLLDKVLDANAGVLGPALA